MPDAWKIAARYLRYCNARNRIGQNTLTVFNTVDLILERRKNRAMKKEARALLDRYDEMNFYDQDHTVYTALERILEQ
jgi:hypothetical protein